MKHLVENAPERLIGSTAGLGSEAVISPRAPRRHGGRVAAAVQYGSSQGVLVSNASCLYHPGRVKGFNGQVPRRVQHYLKRIDAGTLD